MVRILYLEQDVLLESAMLCALRRQGWDIDVANDGATGLRYALERRYEIAALEWSLFGDVDGARICRALRAASAKTGILVFSARSWEDDIIEALESGADEYVAKPCSPRVLVARIHAHLRRSDPLGAPTSGSTVVSHESIQLDLVVQSVQVGAKRIELTRQQFQLLAHMVTNPGRAIPSEEFRRRLFRTAQTERSASLRKQVKSLREALGDAGALIQTARGVGYGIGLTPDAVRASGRARYKKSGS